MTPHVSQFIRQLRPVETNAHGGLQAVRLAPAEGPVAVTPHAPLSPLTAAVATGTANVTDLGGGQVSHLRITNRGDRLLFAMAGELVSGGRQDRVLNGSVLIAPGATADVSVSCIEQHRWDGGARNEFRPTSATATPAVRSAVHDTLVMNLRTTGRRRTDQHRVWQQVDRTLHRTGTHRGTRTGALTGGLAHQRDRLDAYARACAAPSRGGGMPQLGLALFTPGTPSAGLHGFTSLDAFASPDLLNHYASRLVRGAALEALQHQAPTPMVAPPEATQHILAALAEHHPVVSRPAAGHTPGAQELHYAFDGIVASVLAYGGWPVHIAVTPAGELDAERPSRPDSDCRVVSPVSPVHPVAPRVAPPPATPPRRPSPPPMAPRLPDHDTLHAQYERFLLRIQIRDAAPQLLHLGPGTYRLGRAHEMHIAIQDDQVSRMHAELIITADGGTVRDLGSSNGTTVNTEPVLFATLKWGDCIGLGERVQVWLLRTV